MNTIFIWNDESTYTGGNPPRQYKKGDVVPLHIFPPNILKQHMMYSRIIKCEPRQIPDVTLSISVMAHPQRANFFQGLRDKLGDVPFSIDQKNNLIENCKAAWRLHDPSADFHVVIQDDAIVCNNFKERAIKFITARESERIAYNNPVQGYNFFIRQEYPAEKMREFEKQGCLYDGRNRGGVAICLPVNQIESMLEFFDTIDNRHDDERISQWIVKNKFRMCFPIPSLIDHNDHNPSIAGNRPNVIRQAWKFIDNEKKIIPKIIHQLWIGPKPAPEKWMRTWKEKNPGWLYKLWDMNTVNNHKWVNQRHIDFYLKQGLWHGVKDVCQYEILYNEGGAFFDADTECVYPINELFDEEHDAYSYYENEDVRPGLIQPLIAAVKGSQFAKELIEGLQHKPVGGIPWKTTGNQYVGEMFRKTSASVKIFPSGYFNPEHYTGKKSQSDKVYARHYYGSTKVNTYEKGILNVIPKIIHQLWVGPHDMPERWMNTWKEKHPDWEYRLWTEKEIMAEKWVNQKHIDYYMQRKIWHGVSDVCTYEILHNYGGVMLSADSVCLLPIDELFTDEYDGYGVYEQEQIRPGLISPLLASVKGGKFAAELIEGLHRLNRVGEPWISTGNKYMGEMYSKTKQKVKIFPSHYFNPVHLTGLKYEGKDKIYANQMWGTTKNTYADGVENSEKKMIKLSISVMAHPLRAKFFPYLRERLGNVPFSVDQKNNLLENSKAAWRLYDPEADFHVVIQDDCIVCDNFKERAIKFITEQEEKRISEFRMTQGYNFFLKNADDGTELDIKENYFVDEWTRAGLSICLPVKLIEPMLKEFDKQRSRHDDDRISAFMRIRGYKIVFPFPSLIDHRSELKSLANNVVSLRAIKFIDNEEKTMNETVNKIMKGFPGIKFIMLGDGQMEYILDNLDSVLDLEGDVVEMGCNVGMTTSFMRRLLNETCSDKEIHVYESFKGLPPKTVEDGATPCEKGASTVSVEMFKKTFEDAGLKLPVINEGFFADIPDDKYPDKICFAFLDGDFYTSIMDSFNKVYHKMVKGGIILVHDYEYASFPGAKKACDDFLKDKPEKITKDIFGIGKIVKE